MRQVLLLVFTAMIMASCSRPEKFPPFVTEKIMFNDIEHDSVRHLVATGTAEGLTEISRERLDSLQQLRMAYAEKHESFDLSKYMRLWRLQRYEIDSDILRHDEAARWFMLTGFLFQLTAGTDAADEMERVAYTSLIPDAENPDTIVAPYIFTRKGDHVHVNLFQPASVSYQHSLTGAVKITQNTDGIDNGKISLHFNMETKRYIELYIRIPQWMHDASVTVKGVRYLSQAGSYCRIAKQWKEGDVVEIEFPQENLPVYLAGH